MACDGTQHARQVFPIACMPSAHDPPATVHCVVHCLGNCLLTLFINTIHGHY